MSFPHFLPVFRSWITRRETHADLARRISAQAIDRLGPPAIALARQRYAADADIAIDPLETESRLHPGGIEVRAWVRLPREVIPTRMVDAVETSTEKLQSLSSTTRQIFFLSTAYGLALADIALLVRMRPRHIRRAMLEAIAALDGRRG